MLALAAHDGCQTAFLAAHLMYESLVLLCRRLGVRLADVVSVGLGAALTREWCSAEAERLHAAFGKLDLLVSIDLFVNETGRSADFVLPATTWLERDDVPVAFLPFFVRPFVQWTDAVV